MRIYFAYGMTLVPCNLDEIFNLPISCLDIVKIVHLLTIQ